MKAIGASKKKNDKLDARKIADLVRCNLLPACYVAPVEIRELRRMLRYRNLVVAQAVRMKNKMSGLLMEVGAEYNKQRLHGKKYFTELLETVAEVPESVKDLLRLSRGVDVGAGNFPAPGAVLPRTDLRAIHRPFLAAQGTARGTFSDCRSSRFSCVRF